ncbi:hypothetical protein [Mesoaciditoga lauensis]|uniref:hypothetical protein n=1 Tax=Mesoaciditoga lauensis TaxID=1495039 RepID=UPI00055BAAE4|nr:hypothetical protein [Mesoaciditoga lauensis]
MRKTLRSLIIWSLAFSIPFFFIELSFLLSPFSILPTWSLYLLVTILGFSIIIATDDFRIGFFSNLEGAVIASVAYFWVGSYLLQSVGSMPAVMASNAALTSIVTKSMTLYVFSLLGNLVGFLVSGII